MDVKKMKDYSRTLNETAEEIYKKQVFELVKLGYTTRQAKRLLQREARSIIKQRRKGGQR